MSQQPLNLRLDAIQFINESSSPRHLSGCLHVGYAADRWDLASYEVHWGNAHSRKLGKQSLIVDYGLQNPGGEWSPRYVYAKPLLFEFRQTPIPAGASCLLVFVRDRENKEHLYARRDLVAQEHLLPSSASRLERQLAATTARLDHIPVNISRLWDASACPVEFLPWLGWAISSDVWYDNSEDPHEEELRRRDLIRKSAFVHKHKGTRAAIQQVLNTFTNASITLTEWWQQDPPAAPHTFQMDLLINVNAFGVGNAALNAKLRRAIDAVKPVRSHYRFTISTAQSTEVRVAAASQTLSYKRFNMAASL